MLSRHAVGSKTHSVLSYLLFCNTDALQYHGIEKIEIRKLCVKNKGFTFGYPGTTSRQPTCPAVEDAGAPKVVAGRYSSKSAAGGRGRKKEKGNTPELVRGYFLAIKDQKLENGP